MISSPHRRLLGLVAAAALLVACESSAGNQGAATTSATSTAVAATTASTGTSAAATTAPATTTAAIAAAAGTNAPVTTASAVPSTLAHSSQAGPPPAGAIEQVMKSTTYSVTAIKAKAGRLVVHLVNKDGPPVRHDMIVGDALGHRFASSDTLEPGHDLVFTIDNLPPGTYRFYCSFPGHSEAGMKGTITVTS